MKRIMTALLLVALCGCDNTDAWELELRVPADTTPERLMEIRHLLEDNGYKRFKICSVDTIDSGRAVFIHATAKDERRDDRARHVAELFRPTFPHWRWYPHDWSVATAGVFTVRMESVLEDCEESEVKK